MPLTFGVDDVPDIRTPMAYAQRAACGHVRTWIADDGTAASGFTIERIPRADAIAARGRCDRCGEPSQEGLGL